MNLYTVAMLALLAIGLLWAVTPPLTAPRPSRRVASSLGPDGFLYWPACPSCDNIAVSCVGRDPEANSPAGRYRLACDHGIDCCGSNAKKKWPGTGFCGHRWWVNRDVILAAQEDLARRRR